jgi:mono/diheme cytochrome c family protein
LATDRGKGETMTRACSSLPLSIALASLFAGVDALRADDVETRAVDQFVQTVEPLLKSKCVSCHGAEKQEGDLRLDSLAAALKGGESGPAVVAGDPAKSLLVKAVRFDDPDLQMPPKNRLQDEQIKTLTAWIKAGAVWPRPVLVLFDEEEPFLTTLSKGEAKARFERADTHRGKLAVAVTPREKYAEQIADWKLPIRETPKDGEFRYLRFAWKKLGGGGAMLEVAREGNWPPAKASPAPGGRYVAGPNETGMDAIAVGDTAPTDWTVVTIDLWKDLGDCHVTGLSLMASGRGETLFDAMLLAGSTVDLDAWSPGRGELAFKPTPKPTQGPTPKLEVIGTAMEDPRNPIRKLFSGERLGLWSLKPVDSSASADQQDAFSTTKIDEHIQKRLAAAGLKPAPAADRQTIIRRLTFDLTGLPPTPEEVAAFIADKTSDAYKTLVNRLLASPRYGERQARLWLDVVRYADTNGYERDEFRPLIWRYRDYVERSFNADKPFDRFIREQLAGDEIVNGPPRDQDEADALIATGYLRLGQWDSTASIFQEEDRLRAEMMADVTNNAAAAFLGLTFSCCQCHDHKYDPLSQADHYRLRAFFAGVQSRDDLIVETADKLEQIKRHNAALDAQIDSLKAEQSKLGNDTEQDKARRAELEKQVASIAAQKLSPLVTMGATDAGPAAPVTRVLYQGVFREPRDEVSPGFPSVLFPGSAAIEPPRGNTSGRRLALANWIASADNPWAARVIVNRVWQQHFGTGLVATPNDFGLAGSPPTHPQLLDALAAAFVEDGWSIKRLHLAIVMSNAYRQTAIPSRPVARSGEKVDPDNKLIWRQNIRRLDAETLRDNLLAVSGLLKKYDGGKPVWPAVPDELLHAQPAILEAIEGKDGGRRQGWYTDPVEATDVRSLYLIRKRCLPIPLLQAFDLPDTTVSCARRDTTVVAPQALMLLNSPAAVRYAEAFADRAAGAVKKLEFDRAAKPLVTSIFQLALARDPAAEELELSRDLLLRHAKQHRSAGVAESQVERRALIDLCRAVFNLNEFLYVD